MLQQKRSEFLPNAADAALGATGQPTGACLLVCAQLVALQRAATAALTPPNLAAFLGEVGERMHALLLNHMQQFTYDAGEDLVPCLVR